jgi:hypothetical protein
MIGREEGVLSTVVRFVVDHIIPYDVGLERSGLSEDEFQAKIAEIDPNFQR